MKIFRFLILLLVSLISCAAIITAKGNDGSIQQKIDQIENMTDEELLKELNKTEKISVSDFNFPETFSVELSENETWWRPWESVSSKEEAEQRIIGLSEAQEPTKYTFNYIGENDYYYEFHLMYKINNFAYLNRIIVYKDNAVLSRGDNCVDNEKIIRILNRGTILNILDLECFFAGYDWESFRCIYRYLLETDDEYIYTYYYTFIVGGDWGMYDTAYLKKSEFIVNKSTGKIVNYMLTERDKVIKSLSVIGFPGDEIVSTMQTSAKTNDDLTIIFIMPALFMAVLIAINHTKSKRNI